MNGSAGLILALSTAGAVWFALPSPADRRCRALCEHRMETATPPHERKRKAASAGEGPSSRVCALLDLVAAALDAGLAPSRALESVLSVVPATEQDRLRRAAAMLDVGGDSSAVWELLRGDPMLGPLAQALQRSERSGAPVAGSVRTLADELRRDERARRLGTARRVGIRTAVPLGACFLPAFFLIAIVPTVVALIGKAF